MKKQRLNRPMAWLLTLALVLALLPGAPIVSAAEIRGVNGEDALHEAVKAGGIITLDANIYLTRALIITKDTTRETRGQFICLRRAKALGLLIFLTE